MEKVWSDLHALKKLYGLLQRLDETSRALLKKLLDDATRQALLKQANPLTAASDSVIPFSLGLTSPKKMDQTASPSSSFLNNKLPEKTEMEQILSDLEALTKLYSLLHKGPADENLDVASMAVLMKILEDATQEAVRRQAKILSGSLVSPALERKLSMRSDCQTQHADPRLRPVASPRPSLLASEQSRRLNLQHSTVSRRSGLHGDGHRHAAEEPLSLARLASKCSSRTALPARHRPSQEQRHSSLSLPRFPADGTSRHGTVTGGTRLADRRDSICRSSCRGDQWSLERSSISSRSSSRRSVRRRQEILEKRVARLRMLKDKIATVFHHRHDQHQHQHHHLGGGQEAGPSSRSVVRGAGHLNSPWQYLTSMFHRAKGKYKNTRSRTVVGVPEKKRRGGGGGGNMHALFDAVQRHLKGKRRAPAGLKLRRKASRVRAKKIQHWWQRGMARVTAGSRPRHRLGHGKAGWL
ncbi:protein KOKOPELLI [Sorghum bicolor]|uniref:protein KOKOPELLI n=1 Tax=Sorghum bicolor TaxID=4558 RepID=UPI000B425E3A|nr:protein KOKOPELLI [Sorghum bicolor]|eukprot:XP_021319809.1 protein KOKOPELLI [Sorghum bicolor]